MKPATAGILEALYARARSVIGEDILPKWESMEEESVTLRRIRFLNEIEDYVGVLLFLLDMTSFVILFLPFIHKGGVYIQLQLMQYLKWLDVFIEFIFLVELYIIISSARSGSTLQTVGENLHLVLSIVTEIPGLVTFGYALIVMKLFRMAR